MTWAAAESFIRTAYARAATKPGFQTFQIDTYALRLLLLIEQRAEGAGEVARFDEIIKKIERVRAMIRDESRRVHAIQVLEGIEPFVSARVSGLSTAEMNTLVFHLALTIESLDQLSPGDRAQTGSDQVRASVMRAKERILEESIK